MILLLFIVLFLYVIFISLLIFGFAKISKQKATLFLSRTSFSIVVPFRNEKENLPKLLHSISLLNYPTHLFEVILIDDESEETFIIPNYDFSIQLIKNERKSNSPKKDAIETALKIAKNEWIITTDADCLVQKEWLLSFENYIQETNKKMVAAGVRYISKKGFLPSFQNLDFLSLQGATIGSFGINQPFMCNGANFAYKKDFFYELEGFKGNSSVASGDDVFLLQKAVLKEVHAVGFLYNSKSIVSTQGIDNWKQLFFQRVRWASKSTNYSSTFGKTIALLVFFTNLFFIINFILWLAGKIHQNYFVLFFGIKFLVDLILLIQSSNYFKSTLRWVLLSALLYPFFSTSVALYSLFGNYEWKGRSFKK